MQVKVGQFNKANSTGNQSITGVGFKPTLVMLFSVKAATANELTSKSQHIAWGVFNGATDHKEMCVVTVDEHNQANADNSRRTDTSNCLIMYTENGTFDSSYLTGVMDDDGFTMNQGIAANSTEIINYVAIEGETDGLEFDIGSFVPTAAMGTGEQEFTTNIDMSDAVAGEYLLMNFGGGATFSDSNRVHANMGFGATDGTTQYSMDTDSPNGLATPNGRRTARDKWICMHLGTGTFSGEADFVSVGLNKFTIDITDAFGNTTVMLYLIIKGGKWKVSKYTNTVNAQSSEKITGVGFTPEIVMIGGLGVIDETKSVPDSRFSFGMSDGVNDCAGGSWSEAGVTTSNCVIRQRDDAIIADIHEDGTEGQTAHIASLDKDGITLEWDNVITKQQNWLVIMGRTGIEQENTGGATAGPVEACLVNSPTLNLVIIYLISLITLRCNSYPSSL